MAHAFHVFLSHDSRDSDLVHRIWRILDRIGVSAYMYELYPEYGEYLPDVLKDTIRGCEIFVTFLTRNGVLSQWVNQEIGITHAFEKRIVPIEETGVQSKGFVELRIHIPYDPASPEDMIHSLVMRVRQLLFRCDERPNELILECTSCGSRFETVLPSCRYLVDRIERNEIVVCKCLNCGDEVRYYPKTLEPL